MQDHSVSAQVQLGVDWRPFPALSTHIHLLARDGQGDNRRSTLGIPEAYVELNLKPGKDRLRIRGGAMFLPTSRENIDALWENPYAISCRDEHSLRRLAILSELRHAVERDELTLHYQPKIDVSSGRTVHAEALVRWRHPVHGNLPPDEFIPLAEQSGNISMITKWVLRRAIRDCGTWNASGVDLTVAVNLSALDLFDSDLPEFILRLLDEAGLAPSRLVLEITESAVMRDPACALRTLRDLKNLGIALAIDDYGTGYSSLAHLKRLPVDELKIDKSFVLNLGVAADDIVIVRSTIELGHNMGLKVIAEGVESAEAWEILKKLGCDMAQGYFVSPPLPSDEFGPWIRNSQRTSDVAKPHALPL